MPSSFQAKIGRRIRAERRRYGWSQEELAAKVDVHVSYIGQIERGTKSPSLKTFKRLADIFEMPISELLQDDARNPKPYPVEHKMAALLRDRSPRQQELAYRLVKDLLRPRRS